MSVVYIAGPMSGIEDFNRPAFHEVAQALRAEGHTVLNPAEQPDGLTEAQYMQIGLCDLSVAGLAALKRSQSRKGTGGKTGIRDVLPGGLSPSLLHPWIHAAGKSLLYQGE